MVEGTLVDLQEEYRLWLDNLPTGLNGSRLDEKLQAITELDLDAGNSPSRWPLFELDSVDAGWRHPLSVPTCSVESREPSKRMQEPILIKRYAGSRLYDTSKARTFRPQDANGDFLLSKTPDGRMLVFQRRAIRPTLH